MKTILLVLFLTVSAVAQSLEVKELKPQELTKLEAARAKVTAAQAELSKVEKEIKVAYGEPRGPFIWENASCVKNELTVTLEDKYALIRRRSWNVCGDLDLNLLQNK